MSFVGKGSADACTSGDRLTQKPAKAERRAKLPLAEMITGDTT